MVLLVCHSRFSLHGQHKLCEGANIAEGKVTYPGRLLVIKGDEQRKILAQYAIKFSALGSTANCGATAKSGGYVELANRRVAFECHLPVSFQHGLCMLEAMPFR